MNSENYPVAYPWAGLTFEEKTAVLDAKAVAAPNMRFGSGDYYVVQFSGKPLCVPVECFDRFSAAVLAVHAA